MISVKWFGVKIVMMTAEFKKGRVAGAQHVVGARCWLFCRIDCSGIKPLSHRACTGKVGNRQLRVLFLGSLAPLSFFPLSPPTPFLVQSWHLTRLHTPLQLNHLGFYGITAVRKTPQASQKYLSRIPQ